MNGQRFQRPFPISYQISGHGLYLMGITKRWTGPENEMENGHSIFCSVFLSIFQSSPPFSNTSYYKLLVCLQESCQCFHSIFQSSLPFSNTSYYNLSVCLQESCQCFHSIFRSFFRSLFQSSLPFSNTSYYKLSMCLQESCHCFHSVFRSIFWYSPPFSNTRI